MKTKIITAIIALWFYPLCSIAADDTPPPVPPQEQPEVLTSAPVHEAFAEPVNIQVQKGLVVPKPPPANIVEDTPPQRPVGEEFVLIPGYWAWDMDRNDYIWISACWRAAPPNMSWVPGYWAQVDDGWEWVAGFWTPSGNQEIEYLPAPPPISETEPSESPPSEDDIWVPECQYWYQDNYIMRPGYWLAAKEGWVWEPSHYIWTPRGYIFAAGHWDYSLERRGMLFAPVYFPHSLYLRAGFSFSPNIVISIGSLEINLFTRPQYCHYYFGDFYDDAYLKIGIFPQFEVEQHHRWYDPIYMYDRWHNQRTEPHWAEYERSEYEKRRGDKDLRPPKTYYEMETRQAGMPQQERKNIHIARPLTETVASRTTMRFEQINVKTQRKINTQSVEVQNFRDKRNVWESAPAEKTWTEKLKGLFTQPSEHKEQQPSPVGHKISVPQSSEHKEPVSVSVEHKASMNQPADNGPPIVPPRNVRATKAEMVKIPAPPVRGISAEPYKSNADRPPNNPAEEHRRADYSRDSNKDKGRDRGR